MAYKITSVSGVEMGDYAGESPEAALDALARDAGYDNHAAQCEVTGADPSDWTTSARAFDRGTVALFVQLIEG